MAKFMQFTASLDNPRSDLKLNFMSIEKMQELSKAIEHFNEKHIGLKTLYLRKVSKDTIVFILQYPDDWNSDRVTGRELNTLSSYLLHELKWSKYSYDSNKLFGAYTRRLIPKTEYQAMVLDIKNFHEDFNLKQIKKELSHEQQIAVLRYLHVFEETNAEISKDLDEIRKILSKWTP